LVAISSDESVGRVVSWPLGSLWVKMNSINLDNVPIGSGVSRTHISLPVSGALRGLTRPIGLPVGPSWLSHDRRDMATYLVVVVVKAARCGEKFELLGVSTVNLLPRGRASAQGRADFKRRNSSLHLPRCAFEARKWFLKMPREAWKYQATVPLILRNGASHTTSLSLVGSQSSGVHYSAGWAGTVETAGI
jgi:hypothetical protein